MCCIYFSRLSLGKSCSSMCLHMSLQITTSGKYCPTLLAKKKYFSSLLYVLPYVSSKCFPVKILQLYGFSSVYKLACCFWLPLLKNPARHSLQINYFPPACFWIWRLSWLFLEILTPHSLQSNGFSPICVCKCIFRSFPRTNPASHSLQIKGLSHVCVPCANPAPH